MTADPIRRLVVVVPARDEEAHLVRCLHAVQRACRAVRESRPGLTTDIVAVLDSCTDRSAEMVAGMPGVSSVVLEARNVGLARATGISRALAAATTRPEQTWLASTDADTTVPEHWLTRQLDLAEAGHDLVIGTVHPESVDTPTRLVRWLEAHTLGEGHSHVHGANIGVRASSYLDVGGFPPVVAHEDALLVEALQGAGVPWVATDTTRVLTSGRLVGRAPAGFSSFLLGLG